MVTIRYSHHGNTEKLSLADLSTTPAPAEGTLWIDLEAATPEEERKVLEEWFHVHPSALADIRAGQDRMNPLPNVQAYGDHMHSVFDVLELAATASSDHCVPLVQVSQLSILLKANVMVTHHYRPIEALSALLQEEATNDGVLDKGPDHLMHALLGRLIDGSIPILMHVDETIERMDDVIQETPDLKYLADIKLLKKEVGRLRRTAHYQREMLQRLSQREFQFISSEERHRFQRVHERAVRLTDLADSYRDSVNGLIDEHLNLRSQNLNEVMKLLTMISTIFLPLSVITGFYGMNLAYLPWAGSTYSFIAVTAVMVLIAGVMMYRFKRKGWL
jgi:magnesium transporter